MTGDISSLDLHILVIGANPLEGRALKFIIEDLGFIHKALDAKDLRKSTHVSRVSAVVALTQDARFVDVVARAFEQTPIILMSKIGGTLPETHTLPENVHAVVDPDFPCEKLANLIPLVMEGLYIAPRRSTGRKTARTRPGDTEFDNIDAVAQEALLTMREMDVISMIATGSSNKEIARELNIAVNTVNVHVNSVIRKLRVSNRTQIAIWYTSQGQGQRVSTH